ncbi:Cytochrome P450 monooxygenase FUM15 [Fusarium oxysporum f. sp. albedinis]|nr:Cytochrome P450 monooxygenase FUM15 [Fusarium oxysporum f. sp. albedinis]
MPSHTPSSIRYCRSWSSARRMTPDLQLNLYHLPVDANAVRSRIQVCFAPVLNRNSTFVTWKCSTAYGPVARVMGLLINR